MRDVRVNLYGTFLMCRRVVGGMVERRAGRVINVVSSGGVLDGHPFGTSYAASKTGVTRITEGLAQEVADHGVKTFAVGPPAVATGMTRWLMQDERARTHRPLISRIFERGEDHPPEVVADCVAALASGRADALTGPLPAAAPRLGDDDRRRREDRRRRPLGAARRRIREGMT